jgi:hypothetical protein
MSRRKIELSQEPTFAKLSCDNTGAAHRREEESA